MRVLCSAVLVVLVGCGEMTSNLDGGQTADAGKADAGSAFVQSASLTGTSAFTPKFVRMLVRKNSASGPISQATLLMLSAEQPCPSDVSAALGVDAEMLQIQKDEAPFEGTFMVNAGYRLHLVNDGGFPETRTSVVGGTATFTWVGDAGVSGSLSLSMTDFIDGGISGTLNGTFNAPFCPTYCATTFCP